MNHIETGIEDAHNLTAAEEQACQADVGSKLFSNNSTWDAQGAPGEKAGGSCFYDSSYSNSGDIVLKVQQGVSG